ncbi:MAG: hypothetical protein EZS28_034687 [Streblomastix strix]|uniref:MRG domain-containing protein n=1 Tax=Streblomastix strix TaxID=222440 RepID=A0A5J4UG88_9EUKA|nr:MAG: hypothetical protein EZS28_034687 [Streblomastix strix]
MQKTIQDPMEDINYDQNIHEQIVEMSFRLKFQLVMQLARVEFGKILVDLPAKKTVRQILTDFSKTVGQTLEVR